MNKRVIISIIVILSFAFLALLANTYLEIYPKKNPLPPSDEALANNYYALELWLNETGHPVRIETDYNSENFAAIPEKAAIVIAAACNWENAEEYLLPWVEKGNSLVIFLNRFQENNNDESLKEFIKGLGIEKVHVTDYGQPLEENPKFDDIDFILNEDADLFTIRNNQGFIKLAQAVIGEGKITITGIPYFLYNNNLREEANANLAWELTGAQAGGDNTGVLFVRTQYNRPASNSLFGKIMEKGNLVPAGISAVLIVIIGFWSVIPGFGLVFREKQRNSRPIRERFSAEIRFLKKHKALNYYLETYKRELKSDNVFNNAPENDKIFQYGEIINKIRSVYDGTDKFRRGIRGVKT